MTDAQWFWLALPLASLPFISRRRQGDLSWLRLCFFAVLFGAGLGYLAARAASSGVVVAYVAYVIFATGYIVFFEVKPAVRAIASRVSKFVLALVVALVVVYIINLALHDWNPFLANTSWCPEPMHIYQTTDTPQGVVCR